MTDDFDEFDEPEEENPFEAKRSTYEVGYGKPPKRHRFKRGNKAAVGRRKRGKDTRLSRVILSIAGEKLTGIVNGKRMRMSRREALARQLFDMAMKSPKEGARLMQLLLSLEDEPFFDVQDTKIIVEFVEPLPKGSFDQPTNPIVTPKPKPKAIGQRDD